MFKYIGLDFGSLKKKKLNKGSDYFIRTSFKYDVNAHYILTNS